MNDKKQQLELALPQQSHINPARVRCHRIPGAQWWFQQMRQAVAMEKAA